MKLWNITTCQANVTRTLYIMNINVGIMCGIIIRELKCKAWMLSCLVTQTLCYPVFSMSNEMNRGESRGRLHSAPLRRSLLQICIRELRLMLSFGPFRNSAAHSRRPPAEGEITCGAIRAEHPSCSLTAKFQPVREITLNLLKHKLTGAVRR